MHTRYGSCFTVDPGVPKIQTRKDLDIYGLKVLNRWENIFLWNTLSQKHTWVNPDGYIKDQSTKSLIYYVPKEEASRLLDTFRKKDLDGPLNLDVESMAAVLRTAEALALKYHNETWTRYRLAVDQRVDDALERQLENERKRLNEGC